ncbi:hypothetical protein QTP88_010946 [Uroleucon formosanum]
MSIVNSWLLYKRTKLQLGEPVKYTLVEWRKDLAFTLTRQGFQKSTRGRRSTSFEQSLKKINRTRPTVRPTKDVRLDKCDHFPKTDGKRGRCPLIRDVALVQQSENRLIFPKIMT